jgi:transposase-like protein
MLMAKRSFTDAERQKILLEYHQRSEPVSDLLRKHNINQSTLYYWLSNERKSKTTEIRKEAPVMMLPVLSSGLNIIDSVELRLPKGMRLQFSTGASADYVASIVKALV